MNDESAPHKTPSVDIEYQATKFEVCQTCHDEQKTLANEIDQLTLDKEHPELRKKFLRAHLTKLNFENPAETAQIIFSYEAKRQTLEPNFDATKLSTRKLRRIMDRSTELSDADSQQKLSAKNLVNDQNTKTDYQVRIKTLQTDENSNVEIIRTLMNDPVTPKSERVKLENFMQLIALADAPEDQALITNKFNALNLSRLPEPRNFISMQVFDSPQHITGFSEAFQNKVASTYRMIKPPRVVAHSDVRKLAQHKESFTNARTGQVTERYKYDSANNMAEFRPGVGTFMGGERVMLKSITGNVTKDVTGWSDNDIGLTAELMGFHAMTEYLGTTEFVETLGQFNFSTFGSEAFNPEKVRQMRPILSALVGGFEGYDGDVFDARDKMGLIRTQMELLCPNGDTTEMSSNKEGTRAVLEELGLQKNGVPNFDRIKTFGELTRQNRLTSSTDLSNLKLTLDKFS